jgi:hypothetical protein
MPADKASQSDFQPAPPRGQQINVRIDADLYAAATEKAAKYGLGPVIRAFLRAFVRGDVTLKENDLLREMSPAPRRPRKPRKPPR